MCPNKITQKKGVGKCLINLFSPTYYRIYKLVEGILVNWLVYIPLQSLKLMGLLYHILLRIRANYAKELTPNSRKASL